MIQIVKEIASEIDDNAKTLTNRDLIKICGKYSVGINGEPHLPHEIAETALNLLIKKEYGTRLMLTDEPGRMCREVLTPLLRRLPVQSWRSTSQILRQQYSTPAPIAYLLAYLMNWGKGETTLEPSAGTGSIAVWGICSQLNVAVNEIDQRRRELLDLLGFLSTAHDGEFINDLLASDIKPDCLIMNPPFSANGGRTTSNSNKFGFRHVRSAIERLNKGGKFGIILGTSGGIDVLSGNEFWKGLSQTVALKAIVKIDGREYYRNGTSVDTNLFIGKKLLEESDEGWNEIRNRIKTLSVKSVEEAFHAINDLGLRLEK